MSHIPFLCKLVAPLQGNVHFDISQLIVHIAQQLRCLTQCFEGLRSLNNYSWSDQMCVKDASMPGFAAISEKY